MEAPTATFPELFDEARAGDQASIGALLQQYRNYLTVLATSQLEPRLRRRASPSDVVQETMLRAHKDFENFRGGSEKELLGWLRQILVNNLATFVEQHLLAARRDVRREVNTDNLRNSVEHSTTQLATLLAGKEDSPSHEVEMREAAVLLADRLATLSPDYREVLVLRNLQSLPFEQVGQRMDRSSAAARMLWLRAIDKLRKAYRAEVAQ